VKIRISGALDFEEIETVPPRFIFSVQLAGMTAKDIKMLILPNDHQARASIQPVDSKGNPAQIDGLPNWTSSSAAIASVQNIAPDGLSADIVPGTSLGTCQINVTADADLGSGVSTISGVLDVQVAAGQAVAFVITTEPPVPVGSSQK
jgi:hypothetical protein